MEVTRTQGRDGQRLRRLHNGGRNVVRTLHNGSRSSTMGAPEVCQGMEECF